MPKRPPSFSLPQPERRKKHSDAVLASKVGDKGYARKVRSSARWRRVRAKVLRAAPLCVDPFGHHREDKRDVMAEQVHHIVGIVAAPELAFTLSNLAPICTACHAKVEAAERAGRDTTGMFKHRT